MRITHLPSLFISWLLLLSGAGECFAQKEANVWVFGDNIGINFNHVRFTPFNLTGFRQIGASASICDKRSGELLFFTDGRKVWDRSFRLMPNGTELRGGLITTQASLIVPLPESEHQYYLFTTKAYSQAYEAPPGEDSRFTGLHVSIIDMRLNGGLGDVVQAKKNIMLLEKATDKLTAIPHRNGRDYWLLTHEWGTDRYVVFPVTAQGVGEAVYFPFGLVHDFLDPMGWMLPSPDGSMLASAVSNGLDHTERPLELYDFDAAKGILSNRRELARHMVLTGLSFSPDNSKLYYSYHSHDIHEENSFTGGATYQLDLSLTSLEAIRNSRTIVKFIHETGLGRSDTLSGGLVLQLAPDGRLYTGQISLQRDEWGSQRNLIAYIDQPNKAGLSCLPRYREFRVNLAAVMPQSLPNFMQHYFNGLEPTDNNHPQNPGDCKNPVFSLYPNPTERLLSIQSFSDCAFPLRISIYTLLGQRLRTEEYRLPPKATLSFEGLPAATYILMLEYPGGMMSQKVVKM